MCQLHERNSGQSHRGGPRMPPAFSYTFWSMEESWSGAVSLNSSCVETGGFVVSKLKREKNRDA